MPRKPTHTPHRTIRVPDDVWQAALAAAVRKHESVSAAINRYLRDYGR